VGFVEDEIEAAAYGAPFAVENLPSVDITGIRHIGQYGQRYPYILSQTIRKLAPFNSDPIYKTCKTIVLIFLCAFAALREKILKKGPRKDARTQSFKT
jgi:hypothetical protein